EDVTRPHHGARRLEPRDNRDRQLRRVRGRAGEGRIRLGELRARGGEGRVAERGRPAVAYGGAIAAMAVGLGAAAVAPNVWAAAVFVIGMGIGNGVAVVANSLLVQRGTPDHLRGRAFTLAMSVTYSALFVGMLIGGALSDPFGPPAARAGAGVVAGVAAVASYVLARGIPGAVPEGGGGLGPLPIGAGPRGD